MTIDTIANELRDKALDAAQAALLHTAMPDGSAPVGWGFNWSASLAEDVVEAVIAAGIEHVQTRDIISYCFADSRASINGAPAPWPTQWQDAAITNAVNALRTILPPPKGPIESDLLAAIDEHLTEMDSFLRVETPTAVGTIKINREILNRVRAALATERA